MLNQDDVERFWEVCSDMGVTLTESEVQNLWEKYCISAGVSLDSELPVSPRKLHNLAKSALAIR